MIRTLIKGNMLFGSAGYHLLQSYLRSKLFVAEQDKRHFFVQNTAEHITTVLKIFNISASFEGFTPENSENYLLISNHLSYLDVAAIISRIPSVFITSVEIENTPFLGSLCRSGGCLFVERRNTSRIRSEIRAIAKVLSSGSNVVLFPEGTTSNGAGILPFKSVFFQAAKFANVKVLPLCIGYTEIDEQPFSLNNKDLVCYHGNTTFAAHLVRLLGTKSIHVHLKAFKPIDTENLTTRDLSRICFDKISACYEENFLPKQ